MSSTMGAWGSSEFPRHCLNNADNNSPWKQSAHLEGKPSSFYSHKISTEGVHWKKQARFSSVVTPSPQMSLYLPGGLVRAQIRPANVLHE